MIKSFSKIKSFQGELKFSGDKSVSHRALIFSSMAEGESVIRNLSKGEDVTSTINCLRELGITIIEGEDFCTVSGKGFKGLIKPNKNLNAGNSGTTARLLAGVLSAQNFISEITGDQSLLIRPMKRVIDPLILMGADIQSSGGFLPIKISPVSDLHNIEYEMPVASAQVKSSIILAALHCEDESIIKEKSITRNHTEIMLGLPIENSEGCRKVTASNKYYPAPADYFIPGDISSAAFFIILTLLTEGSSLIIKDVLLNNTRTAILDILTKMGGKIEVIEQGISAGEVYGDIFVEGSKLKNIPLPPEIIPGIIDEIPALTIAGIFADGDFEIRNAAELRIKESDRINSIIENLHITDLNIEEFDDGFRIAGHPGNKMPVFDSFGDHRIAMAFSIFSMLLQTGGSVNQIESYKISNPDFLDQIIKLK